MIGLIQEFQNYYYSLWHEKHTYNFSQNMLCDRKVALPPAPMREMYPSVKTSLAHLFIAPSGSAAVC